MGLFQICISPQGDEEEIDRISILNKSKSEAPTEKITKKESSEENERKARAEHATKAASATASKDTISDLVESAREYTPMIEIISCHDLLIGDSNTKSSDPYVNVTMDSHDLHETKHLLQTLNPVYTKKDNNQFSLRELKGKDSASKSLLFKIKDWNKIGFNDELGSVQVQADFFYKCQNEKTQEFKINPPHWNTKKKNAGYITIKCRPTTNEDEEDYYQKQMVQNSFGNLFGSLRKKEQAKAYGPPDLHLLIEIVSCGGLLAADINNTSDPYVKVNLGKKDVHQTMYKPKTLDPIYTIASNSLFTLDITAQELIDCRGLFFSVWDHDLISHDDKIGYTLVSAKTILQSTGERTEFTLKTPSIYDKKPEKVKEDEMLGGKSLLNNESTNSEEDAGDLCLRIRRSTQYDRDFLKHANANDLNKFLNLQQFNMNMEITKMREKRSSRQKESEQKISNDLGPSKYLVRPYPNPERPSETTYMTEEELESECLKPSINWIDAGSGDFGRIYLEVLGAKGLPDLGGGKDNKSDPFIAIVYEDCVVRTEEINNCRSPKFLPWTRRAFVFRMMYSSSALYVGVFEGDNDRKSNDFIGQTPIELSNLFAGTDYTLEYDLYKNKNSDRSPLGTVTVRLRFEIEDSKQLVLSKLRGSPDIYVCANNKTDFDMIQKTVNGADSMLEYGGATFFHELLDELSLYLNTACYYVAVAVISLLFWRGQVPLPVLGYCIPLHSFVLFYMAITLVEDMTLFPSYFFFSITWLLVSIQVWNNCFRPNPWTKKKSFLNILYMLAFRKLGVGDIPVGYLKEQSEELNTSTRRQIELNLDESQRYQKEEKELVQQQAAQMKELGDQVADTNISSSIDKISLDPLKSILYPIQLKIVPLIRYLRFVKNIILWNEPYYAFIIGLISFIFCFVFWIFPFRFFALWTGRFVAWVVLGPHMKLVDICWYSQRVVSKKDYVEQRQEQIKASLEQAKANVKIARLQKEDTEKLRDMKVVIFGKYLSKLPPLCSELYVEHPKHTSEAKPHKKLFDKKDQHKKVIGSPSKRLYGQKLVGDMIPKLIHDDMASAIAEGTTQQQTADAKDSKGTKISKL